jgi:hypothetical protein
LKKLKDRWNIESNWQMFVILLVFAITGSTAAKLGKPLTSLVGVTEQMGGIIYWGTRILIIFPAYQILLVFYGWLFGEWDFFWKFEKKMLRSMKLGFLFKDKV